jgi:retinol dehydrogenase-12
LKSELQRHIAQPFKAILEFFLYDAIYGAYTELFAGLSPDVKLEDNGKFIIPWGRFGDVPGPVAAGLKAKEEGGSGKAELLWEYCDEHCKAFV